MEFLFKCIRHIFKYTQCTLTYSCGSRIVIMSISYFTVVNAFYSYWGRWRATLSGSRLLCGWWFCSQCWFLVSFFLSFSCHFSVYQFLSNSFMSPALLRQWDLAWCPDGSFIPASGAITCMEFVTATLFSLYIWVYDCCMVYEMRGGALEVCQAVCIMFTLTYLNVYFI